ncbi:MAG: hypothetical protein JOZ49_03630, partial [Mycolicibacterium sp.]|nr:hypothetical protein [Mycolicibacterium sp.]
MKRQVTQLIADYIETYAHELFRPEREPKREFETLIEGPIENAAVRTKRTSGPRSPT